MIASHQCSKCLCKTIDSGISIPSSERFVSPISVCQAPQAPTSGGGHTWVAVVREQVASLSSTSDSHGPTTPEQNSMETGDRDQIEQIANKNEEKEGKFSRAKLGELAILLTNILLQVDKCSREGFDSIATYAIFTQSTMFIIKLAETWHATWSAMRTWCTGQKKAEPGEKGTIASVTAPKRGSSISRSLQIDRIPAQRETPRLSENAIAPTPTPDEKKNGDEQNVLLNNHVLVHPRKLSLELQLELNNLPYQNLLTVSPARTNPQESITPLCE